MITPIPESRAIATIPRILAIVIWLVIGPVFPATSLVPASICTSLGFNAITSDAIRKTICGVVCPLIPRQIQPSRKKEGSILLQFSVMESPRKTMSTGEPDASTRWFSSTYLASQGQSSLISTSVRGAAFAEAAINTSAALPSSAARRLMIGCSKSIPAEVDLCGDAEIAVCLTRDNVAV